MTGQKQNTKGFAASLQVSGEEPRPALEVRLQKTKLCLYHLRSVCKHGSKCRFAHGQEELKDQPDLSKTRMCPDLLAGGCTNPNCQHAHSLDEIKATNFCYKTTQCMWYASGRCRNGSECRFAHGEQDRNKALDLARELKTEKEVQQQQQQNQQMKQQEVQQQLELQQLQQQWQQQWQMQQQQHQQQQPQHQQKAKDMLEPMFIQANSMQSIDQMHASQNYLPLHGLLSMQQGMGYPKSNMTGLPQGLTSTWNVTSAGLDKFQNPAVVPEHALPESAELNKVQALSKHIKSLRKQVKKLQDTVNHTMRSDSDNSTLSGNVDSVSGSSSNDDVVPSKTSSNETENAKSNGAMGNNRFRKQQAYADNKLAGA